jgi:hypothetical protein
MPSIPISNGVSVTADAQLAPWSVLAQYAQDFPKLVASGADLSRWKVLTLSDPAVTSLDTGLKLERPVPLGKGAPELILGGDAAVHFEVLTGSMFSPDVHGDNIAIPDGQCAVHLGITANAIAGVAMPSGSVTFGLDAVAGIAIDTYRCFPNVAPAPTVLEALTQSLGELVIPFKPADTGTLPTGVVVTLGGSGSLTFSATANLLAMANPLASVALPAPLPGLAVKEGASVKIGAAWTIASEYQVRVHKVDANRVRLGWYRKHSSDFSVAASARAGVAAGTSSEDLFPRIIGVISPDAKAGAEDLKNASPAVTGAIEDTVKKAINRKLEVAIAAEIGALKRDEAAFLYELDLAAMNDAARAALGQALRGDLTGFAQPQAGVTEVRSILKKAQASRFTIKVNLLGIFNFASISRLALEGTVTFTPSTGELVIVDKATAARIQTGSVNFGANEEKLRQVMAESFLITAAYRGTKTALLPPTLKSAHSYFRLDNETSREELNRGVLALEAVGLNPQPLPPKETRFGRTTVSLEANYDDPASLALFVDDNGKPRSVAEYEDRGRAALELLVPADGPEAYRLRPATNPVLWKQMKDVGPTNFGQFFRGIEADVVRADYLAIRWWADSMHSTAELVEQVMRPGAADSAALREKLAKHLKEVAKNAHEQFGSPWGLVAMFLVAGGRAVAGGAITGPRFVYTSTRPLVQGA